MSHNKAIAKKIIHTNVDKI